METGKLIGFVVVLAILIFFGTFVAHVSSPTSPTSSSSSSNLIQGIITGFVTVGPSQPSCSANQSCNVNLSGYSLQFTSVCQGAPCQSYLATIAPSGHYSILLAQGQYSITGLVPSCNWVGCFTTFPLTVEVVGGSQIVANINIDTGIR